MKKTILSLLLSTLFPLTLSAQPQLIRDINSTPVQAPFANGPQYDLPYYNIMILNGTAISVYTDISGKETLGVIKPGQKTILPLKDFAVESPTFRGLRRINNRVIGFVNDKVFATDGSEAGTIILPGIMPIPTTGNPARANMPFLRNDNKYLSYASNVDLLFFFAKRASDGSTVLVRSDGAANGTVILKDGSGTIQYIGKHGTALFNIGTELYFTDGTNWGTKKIKDDYITVTDYSPYRSAMVFGKASQKAVFGAKDSEGNYYIQAYDGKVVNTLASLGKRASSFDTSPSGSAYLMYPSFTQDVAYMFYPAREGETRFLKLLITDGTLTGTHTHSMPSGLAFDGKIAPNGDLYVLGSTITAGSTLSGNGKDSKIWRVTKNGTVTQLSSQWQLDSVPYQGLHFAGGKLVFQAKINGFEVLLAENKLSDSIVPFFPSMPSSYSSIAINPHGLPIIANASGDGVYFDGLDGNGQRGLYMTRGGPRDAVLVKKLDAQSQISAFTDSNTRYFGFAVRKTGALQSQYYLSTGSPEKELPISLSYPGFVSLGSLPDTRGYYTTIGVIPYNLDHGVKAGNRVFTQAVERSYSEANWDYDVWSTDGTIRGTKKVLPDSSIAKEPWIFSISGVEGFTVDVTKPNSEPTVALIGTHAVSGEQAIFTATKDTIKMAVSLEGKRPEREGLSFPLPYDFKFSGDPIINSQKRIVLLGTDAPLGLWAVDIDKGSFEKIIDSGAYNFSYVRSLQKSVYSTKGKLHTTDGSKSGTIVSDLPLPAPDAFFAYSEVYPLRSEFGNECFFSTKDTKIYRTNPFSTRNTDYGPPVELGSYTAQFDGFRFDKRGNAFIITRDYQANTLHFYHASCAARSLRYVGAVKGASNSSGLRITDSGILMPAFDNDLKSLYYVHPRGIKALLAFDATDYGSDIKTVGGVLVKDRYAEEHLIFGLQAGKDPAKYPSMLMQVSPYGTCLKMLGIVGEGSKPISSKFFSIGNMAVFSQDDILHGEEPWRVTPVSCNEFDLGYFGYGDSGMY